MSLNQRSDTTGYRMLTAGDWLAYESCLKGLLRVREPLLLAQQASEASATLHQLQSRILHRAWRWPLQQLPLMLCRGPARSGANFLRWRNQQNNRSGLPGWQALVQDVTLAQPIRDALLLIEYDRVAFNMQMSIISFILRQTRECATKVETARNIAISVRPL
ncbi:DUF3158 family protein [Salmonella enterica subsp. enterica]|nr:DUF3158 family protein [Salmonella enterica subsp. enterica]